MIRYFLFFSLLFSTSLSAQHWSVTEQAALPEPVSNNAVAEGFINGMPYLYTFGGIDSTKLYSGIHLRSYRLDVQGNQWESIPALPDTLGKIAASANRVGDYIYIIGGYHVYASGNEKSSDRVHRYHIPTNTYIADGAAIPVPIDDQVQAVWRDSLIYVVTGWSETRNVPDVQIYDPANDNWQMGTSLPLSDSYMSFGSSGVIVEDTIYYFGGARNGSFNAQANFRIGVINRTDPTDISWSARLPNANRKGYRMAATAIGKRVYWIGGSTDTYNFDGLSYSSGNGVPTADRSLRFDITDGSWEEDFSNVLPMDLRGIGNISNEIKYLAGGMQGDQEVTARTFRLEWKDISTSTVEQSIANQILLSPNPTVDFLEVQSPEAFLPLHYQLFDASGKLVAAGKENQSRFSLSTHTLSPGLYSLQLRHEGVLISKKVLVQ